MKHSGSNANESVVRPSAISLWLDQVRGYGLAVLSVGVAVGALLLFEHLGLRSPTGMLLLVAVAISSWYGESGPALLSLIVAFLCMDYFFIDPRYGFTIATPEIPYYISFVSLGTLIWWFSTVRRRIEADLRQSRDNLREQANLLNLSHDAIFVMDMEGVIKYWNHGSEERYGWTTEEALGKVVHDLLNTELTTSREQIKADVMRIGRWEGELVQTQRDGSQIVVATRWSLQRNEQGTPIAILETNNDISERKRAEEELRAGEVRFRTFVDHAGDAFFVLDGQQQGKVLDVNRQACESLGYSREELIGMVPQEFDPEVDAALLQKIRERIDSGEVCTFETRHQRKDGAAFPVEIRVRGLSHGGRRLHLALARDISERKRTEEALRRLNRELRAISNCNQSLLRATDEQSLVEEICRIVCEEAGYRMAWVGYAEQDEARSVRPVAWSGTEDGYLATASITWADTERGRGPAGTAIRSGKSCYVQDYATDTGFAPWREGALGRGFRSGIVLPLKGEDAKAFGCFCIYSAEPDAFTQEEIRLLEELAGDLAFGIVTLRSRAARKKAEQEITLLSFALNHVRESAFLIDERGRFDYVNEEACRTLGYTRAELLGMAVPDIDPELLAGRWSDHWRERKKHGSLSFESRHRTRDGRILPVEISANYFEYGGRTYTLALVRDISERKRAEEALRRSEAYLAEAQRLSHTGSWAWDVPNYKNPYWSEEMFRILGLGLQELAPTELVSPMEKWDRLMHPEDRDRVHASVRKSLSEKVDTSDEYRMVMGDGTVKHVLVIRHPVLNEAGDVVELVGTVIDITERKHAEEALRRSEAYLAESQRLTHTGSWAWDTATGKYVYWSEELFRIFGFDPQEGFGALEEIFRRFHPEDRETFKANFERSLREKIRTFCECRFVLPDGTLKHLHLIRHPVLNEAGDVVQLVGTTVDITERKRAEQALRESETRFRTFVDHAGDAFFVYDLEQRTIVDLNREACESLGYSQQELIGKSPLAFHLDSYEAEMESIASRAVADETVIDTHWHRRKDGTVFPVEVHTTLVSYTGRQFLLMVARDISDRLRAEKAIRETEKQLRDVIDSIPALVWSTLPDGSVDFINRRTVEFTGLSFEQASDEGWQSVIHPDDRDHYLVAQRAAVVPAQAFEIEARIRRADGEYRWMLFRSVPLRDERGTVLKRYGVSTDIDDRNRAQQALKRSEAYLADAQRLVHTGSWAWDPATRQALYWSEEMFRIFGLDPQKGVPDAEVFWQRIHPDDFDRTYEVLMKAAGGNVDYEHEHRIVLPDGTVKHIHAIGHPVLDQSGRVIEYAGTAVDITQRKRAEEALRRAEGYLVEAQRLTHTGAWATDAVPKPLYWSEELFRLYGLDPQQGFPTHEQAVQRVHPEDRGRYVQAFHRVIHQKVDSDVEFRTVLPDGTIRYLYGLGHPILNTNGDVVEVVGTTVDITERKRAEEERTRLRQLEADLAHINRVSMMGELAASIAHEVNQPLSGIVSSGGACLRWMAADPPNMNEVREAVRRIVAAGKHAGEVIARIRALTKRTVEPKEKLDLNETIRQVLILVGDEAKRNKVIIRTRFADVLSPVLGDRVQFQQVVLNLVVNAIEAMSNVNERARELVITTRNIDAEQIQVTVEDSGVGIDPNTIQKIFDPFYTTKSTGMGMGLSISRSILQHHGGRIWATANDGPGTSFNFTLPKYHEEESNAGV